MGQWAELLLTGVVAGLFGACATYVFALRKDKEERRRDRLVAHLLEAYRNIEDAVGRDEIADDQLERLEKSIAATFLLGSKAAAEEAARITVNLKANRLEMLPLLLQLRKDLRHELGLERHDAEIRFLRLPRNKGK
ncbi:hypothetical protein [Planktotalea sp.]|uniref:hypothetical protein n=1 Tax=Planktotalea sp. TaxID=2029877 RepID=UPI0035C840AA